MIIAEIYTQNDGKIVAFVLRGHSSGKEGHGYNIRCAEASMLSQSAYLGIRKYLNRDVAAENHEHGGLGVELKEKPDELTEAVFQTMLIGLKAVEEVAPDAVKIKMIAMNKAAEDNLQSKINRMNPSPARALPKVNVEEVKIRVNIYRNDGGKIIGFSVEESDTEVEEFKIYRAAIWVLVKAAFSCVKDYLKRDLEFKADSARLEIKLKNPDEVTEAVFQTMLIGVTEVEKLTPQIVKVEEKFLGGENK